MFNILAVKATPVKKKKAEVVEKTKLLERSVFRQVSGTGCAGTLAMPELRQEKKRTVRKWGR